MNIYCCLFVFFVFLYSCVFFYTARNLQIMVETMNYHFNETLKVIEQAGDSSELFLRAVSPNILQDLVNETLILEVRNIRC